VTESRERERRAEEAGREMEEGGGGRRTGMEGRRGRKVGSIPSHTLPV